MLVSGKQSPQAMARLKAFCATNDGFRIAEEDLRLRGPGDFFGARQSGLPAFRCASLENGLDVLEQARQAADAYVAGPGAPEDAALRERVRALFERGTAMN